MSKIVIPFNGQEYTLEFSRKTVAAMEDSGFVIDLDKPNTMVDRLFYGAFQMHHKRIERDFVRKIWDAQFAKDQLLAEIIRLYREPLDDLMADPKLPEGEDNEGANPTPAWKVV